MTVAGQIRSRIDAFPAGYVFTLSDFGLDPSNEIALAKLLSRMAASGELMKAAGKAARAAFPTRKKMMETNF